MGIYMIIEFVVLKLDWVYKLFFEVGECVKYVKFGIGVVIVCNLIKDDLEVIVVFFGVIGVKKFV